MFFTTRIHHGSPPHRAALFRSADGAAVHLLVRNHGPERVHLYGTDAAPFAELRPGGATLVHHVGAVHASTTAPEEHALLEVQVVWTDPPEEDEGWDDGACEDDDEPTSW